ncbi:hypothetical protein AB0H12_22660 [Actinosynnema sp. NPDC023794]
MNYPQQPPSGQDPYGQPGQYGGYQYGGFAPQPPPTPKKRTGAIVAAVGLVVLVLGGVAFTGFVQPGFFLGAADPTTTTTAPPTTASSTTAKGGDAEKLLEALVAGLDSQDAAALKKLKCPKAKSGVDNAIEDVSALKKAELVSSDEVTDDKVEGTVEVTTSARTSQVEVTVVREDGDWCWQDIARAKDGPSASGRPTATTAPTTDREPTAGGKPVPPEALAAMRSFLDSVNAGDAATAAGLLCSDAINDAADVEKLVGYDPDLAIDPAMDGRTAGEDSFQAYLKGTAKGQKVGGYSTNLWVTSYDGPWCVHAFRVVVT